MDEKKVREAIKYFKIMLFDMEGMKFKYIPKYYETAIEALEKQLPMKAEEIVPALGRKGYECKCCGGELEYRDTYSDYCKWCGQRIDWSEEDE